jgi:hypothetical protein
MYGNDHRKVTIGGKLGNYNPSSGDLEVFKVLKGKLVEMERAELELKGL